MLAGVVVQIHGDEQGEPRALWHQELAAQACGISSAVSQSHCPPHLQGASLLQAALWLQVAISQGWCCSAAQCILPIFYLLEMNSYLNIRGLDTSRFPFHIPRVALVLSISSEPDKAAGL